jgi:hypothetical protein
MTVEWIKKKAKQIAADGFRTNFNQEWVDRYFKPDFAPGMTAQEAALLSDLIQILIDFTNKRIDQRQASVKAKEKIEKFKRGELIR